MSIAIAQLAVKPGAPAENTEKMLSLIAEAKAARAEMIIFPELSISGRFLDYKMKNRAFLRECRESGYRIAAQCRDITVIFGNFDQRENQFYNTVFMARDGELKQLSAPMGDSYIAGAYDMFAPSRSSHVYEMTIEGQPCRVGFLLGDWRNREFPYKSNEVDLIIDITNRPYRPDKPILPARLPRPFISVNSFSLQNSGKAYYLFGGGSFFRDGQDILRARGDYLKEGLYIWSSEGGDISTALTGDQLLGEVLVSGVREFMSSIGCNKAVIGISGGIDSALASCIYSKALGPQNVYLISMPSRFNSNETKSLAAGMAKGLGTNFAVMPIQKGVDELLENFAQNPVQSAGGESRPLEFSGSVKENIQARERCRILAAAAAAVGGIFTCNGNKAELSVGYATFYGDLAGAFAAQADLWKHQVYRASSYFQTLYPDAPLDEIAAIRPSAELSENHDVTKGLGDPLIYAYHDYLLAYWVERNADIYHALFHYEQGDLESVLGCEPGLCRRNFPTAAAFIEDLERWWRLYQGTAIAKRIQAPPLLALSARPFGEEHPESQGAVYYSNAYRNLKARLLGAL
ncbi:MAG: NAD(+) synthase [Firmicutes bacterium]|nr:NAD(+) synthase [Bacillota bacterium]